MLAPQYLQRSTLWSIFWIFWDHLAMLFTLETSGLVIGNRMQRCLVEVETKMFNVLKIKKFVVSWKTDGICNNKHKVPDSNWQYSIDKSSNQLKSKQTQKSGHLISKKWGSTHSHPVSLGSEMIYTEIEGVFWLFKVFIFHTGDQQSSLDNYKNNPPVKPYLGCRLPPEKYTVLASC